MPQHLFDTPFMRELSERAAATLRAIVDGSKPRIGESTRPFTAEEEYVTECLLSAGQLGVACDQMQYALTYLSGYRARHTASGELISRTDYIRYQLENLYLRIGMLLDRSLKLTNTVFRLGIPPRECRVRVVADNGYVRKTAVRDRLRAIDKAVQPLTQVRNKIAHHSRYRDPGLDKVERYFILEKSSRRYPIVESERWWYKERTDRYVENRRSELAPVVEDLIDLVSQLFDALLPIFHAGLSRY